MKTKLLKFFDTYMHKLAAGFLALAGLGEFLLSGDWTRSSWLIAYGLAHVLLAKEPINDERVTHLKLKAISLGFYLGLLPAMTDHLFTVRGGKPVLSAFDLVILVSCLALGLFHYWRWRDGQEAKRDEGAI